MNNIDIQTFVAHDTTIKHEVEFFSGPFGDADELVVMINDPNQELTRFNQSIKKAMHQANDDYQQTHHKNLYDITKSEQYSYVPHIGLGRIRANSIKNQLKDQSQFPVIFERIQSRTKKITLEYIKTQLNSKNEKLVFDKIVIFNPTQQSFIKEYTINNEQK